MVLSVKTAILWSLCMIISAFGDVSGDVIDLSTNQTQPSEESTTKVDDALSGIPTNSNTDSCLTDDQCQNGGSCVYRTGINRCECRNGTRGDQCEIVEECVKNILKCGKDPEALCSYNVDKESAECKCLNASKGFDSNKKKCRLPCKTSQDCPEYIYCRGNPDNNLKFCRCPFGLRGDKCLETIDECKAAGLDCGNNTDVTCEKNMTDHAVCHCKSWSDGFNYEAKDCLKCNCEGSNLGCLFYPGGEKKCYCDKKYYQKDGKCEDCKCGSIFKGCKLENGIKRCDCYDSYVDNDGTCENCYCGKNSDDCTFENGMKKCTCKQNYIQSDGTCRRYCSEGSSNTCKNGGKCVENVCQCLPGTKGDQCEIVEGCEASWEITSKCGYSGTVSCQFNQTSGKPYCQCLDTYLHFDSFDKQCKSCNCGLYGDCHFVSGQKKCVCEEGYSERPAAFGTISQCEKCNCGLHSSGCHFKLYFHKECYCNSGYAQVNNNCKECNCGPNGDCSFDDYGRKVCSCYDTYSEKNGYCEECDCGSHGKCVWDEYGRQSCDCPQGYGIRDSECTRCTCYLNGENTVNCTFTYGYQECTCPPGYEESVSSFCWDINECNYPSACPINTECTNTIGSYTCSCKKGYKPISPVHDLMKYGCKDINECVEQNECPFRDTTECINTNGSYYCVCKSGYYSWNNKFPMEMEGCQKDQSGWKIGYVILIIVFSVVSLGLIIAICKKRSSA